MLKKLYQWHRKLAWILFVPTVLWLISGLTHPLMSNVFTVSMAERELPEIPLTLPSQRVSLPAVMKRHQIDRVDQVRLVLVEGVYYYQLHFRTLEYAQFQVDATAPSQPNPHIEVRYFAVTDGQEWQQGDQAYAEYLARYFLGDQSAVVAEVELITEFTTHYPSINRLLPVYRLRFDREDQVDVYVDTLQSRWATASHHSRRVLNWVFRYLHTWAFLGDAHSLWRLIPVTFFISLMLLMGVIGLVMYGLLWKRLRKQVGSRQRPIRRWHRRLGLLVAISFIGFASSGVHTVLMKYTRYDVFAYQPIMAVNTDSLEIDPLGFVAKGDINFSLARMGDEVYWQLHQQQGRSKQLRYINAADGRELAQGDQVYAEYLARQVSGLPDTPIKPITYRDHFGHDYPVIFKRLPVQKVGFQRQDWLGYFVETQTGSIAGRVSKPGFFQVIHFQWLHKYHFLDRWLSRGQRDLVISIMALLILAVVGMGGVLLLKRKA